jgi:hypothetical protein
VEAGITEQTYYRWREECGGLKLEQAKRLKELEKENAKLKQLAAELWLEKQILKDAAEETTKPRAALGRRGTRAPEVGLVGLPGGLLTTARAEGAE